MEGLLQGLTAPSRATFTSRSAWLPPQPLCLLVGPPHSSLQGLRKPERLDRDLDSEGLILFFVCLLRIHSQLISYLECFKCRIESLKKKVKITLNSTNWRYC